jgi:hypothetical protein
MFHAEARIATIETKQAPFAKSDIQNVFESYTKHSPFPSYWR